MIRYFAVGLAMLGVAMLAVGSLAQWTELCVAGIGLLIWAALIGRAWMRRQVKESEFLIQRTWLKDKFDAMEREQRDVKEKMLALETALRDLGIPLPIIGDPLKAPAPADFDGFIERCVQEQKPFAEMWGIDDCERWDVDQQRGTITFTNTKNGHAKLAGMVQIIGSYNAAERTWLWSWANESVNYWLKMDALKLRQYGHSNHLPQLIEKRWKGELEDGWKMTALAAKLLRAEGAYRGAAGDLSIFMVIRNLKVSEECQAPSDG